MNTKSVAIIGCGNIYGLHAAALKRLPKVKLVAVCDTVSQRAERAANEHDCKAYTDYKKMVAELKPDCVHICLPHYLHTEVSVWCMENGCDVVCEKPMCIKSEDIDKLLNVKNSTGKKFAVIFQNRFNPSTVFIRNALDLRFGLLGKIKNISAKVNWFRDMNYYNSGEWRGKWATEGGGVLINQAIHTFDLLMNFADSDVKNWNATLSHNGATTVEVEDTAEGEIEFKNGVHADFFFTNCNTTNSPVELHIECEYGKLDIVGSDASVTYADGEVDNNDPEEMTLGIKNQKDYWGDSHRYQIRDFYLDESGISTENQLKRTVRTMRMVLDIFAHAKRTF